MEVPSIYLNKLLSGAAKKGASSLHLSIGSVPVMRINGRLTLMESEEMMTSDLISKIVRSFASEEELEKLEKERSLVLAKTFAGNFRFRVNIFYQKNSLSLSFNYISGIIRDLNDLDLPEQLTSVINLNSGLLILAGPDNSGKTSTAASFIEEMNKNRKKYIMTIEDPIEYVFINKQSMIEQREIGKDVKSYSQGLEHFLNEDVDVVYIDEIKKDFEKAVPLILELASGNSLVIFEMNADNSIRVIEKILNSSPKSSSQEAMRYNLADVLVGVIAHRLIPSIGGGMALAKEILITTSPIKSLIREGKIYQIESSLETSRGEGMISLKKSVEELINNGKITKEEADKLNL